MTTTGADRAGRRPVTGPAAVLDRHFGLTARGTTWRREALAGASTFLALSYIVIVNPAVLAQAGIPRTAAFLATAAVGGLATVAMGLWARLPFAVAPGMEMNSVIAFSVVGTLAYSWQQALGMVFWSGVAMLVVSLLRVREAVIDAIPAELRSALAGAVAVFIALIGLQIGHLLRTSDGHLAGVGDWTGAPALALGAGLAASLLVDRFGGRARAVAVPAGILVSAVVCTVGGVRAADPGHGLDGGAAALFRLDLAVVADPRAWGVILVLFALDFFGSIAKVVGLTAHTPLQDGAGKVPGMRQALLIDAGATVAGSAVGSSSFVAFVESAVGIRAGARSGLSSVTTGLLLLLCLFFAPFLAHLPVEATAGALVFVAVRMLAALRPARGDRLTLAAVAVAAAVTVATLAIDQAMAAAFATSAVLRAAGRRPVHPALWITTLVLAASVLLQYLQF
ncbi:solute carrier family 23 protein [Kitasatospora sp. NPDC059646]|uniref:solute carrier family 23 protein n=1 Tax=Kitasatospora sp. NPDC059646 TaxID=3346893 RepID=UPI0036ADBCEA